MSVVSFTDLQQQITQRERELQSLRRELESRQNQVTELTRRKEKLQRQLQQVKKEITALANAGVQLLLGWEMGASAWYAGRWWKITPLLATRS